MASTAAQLSEVTRTVVPVDGGHDVILAQTYSVTPEELWNALTDPERLAVWFLRPTGELREGGRYELAEMGTTGTVQRCEKPSTVLLSWESMGSTSELELGVEAADEGSRFTLRHRNPAGEHWDRFGPAATGCGWDGAIFALAAHLKDPSADLKAGQFACWETSAEAAEFTRDTAAAWAASDIAAGVDPDAAREAAERTAAFYLGEESPEA